MKYRDTHGINWDFEQDIHLQLVEGFGISSSLIAWFGGIGHFSHAAALVEPKLLIDSRDDVQGGKPPGVNARPQDYEKWRRKMILRLHVGAVKARAWRGWLDTQVREKRQYDQAAIEGFIEGNTRLHTRGDYICSALQFEALVQIGVFHRVPFASHEVSPNELFGQLAVVGFKVTFDSLPPKAYEHVKHHPHTPPAKAA